MDDAANKIAQEEALKNWEIQVAQADEDLKATHTKREFTFTSVERMKLLKVVGMNAFAQEIEKLAQQLADNILNQDVLIRLGVTPSPSKKILYEPGVGRLTLWEPREVKKSSKT